MAKLIVVCLGVFLALTCVKALTKDELAKIEAGMLEHFHECNTQFGVTDEDLKAAKEDQSAADAINPCLISCVFKKALIIDEKGLFDSEKVTELSKNYLNDEEDLAKVADIISDCAHVNEETVSDGEEGCERSKSLLACFTKHKGELTTARRR